MLTEPLNAEPRDYQAIVDLTEVCFPRDKELGGMVPRWGHCFRKDRVRNSLVIKDADRIVSHVGCIDQTVMVGPGSSRVCGISSVATSPGYRGRGLMSKLLNRSIEFMKDEGYVLSDLGGDRVRYRRFGWERAGRNCRFMITPRSLSAGATPEGYEVGELTDTPGEMRGTLELHNSSGFGLQRDSELHDILLHRSGKVTLIAWNKGALDAYAVANIGHQKSITIDEIAGGAGGVISIIHRLFQNQAETITLPLPFRHSLCSPVMSISSGWSVDALRMIRILDLEGLLRDFSGQIESRASRLCPTVDIELTLCIEGEDNTVNLSIGPGGVDVGITDGNRDATVLSGQDMVLLLFWPCNPGMYAGLPPAFASLLPLDFYIWGNEGV